MKLIRFSRDALRAMINASSGEYDASDNQIVDALEIAAHVAMIQLPHSIYWDTATASKEKQDELLAEAQAFGFLTILLEFRPPLDVLKRRLAERNKKGGRQVDFKIARAIYMKIEASEEHATFYKIIMTRSDEEQALKSIALIVRNRKTFIMTLGAPASGKTTFFRMLKEEIK